MEQMLASLGAVTRSCHELDEQVRYLVEKLTLFFQMFKKSFKIVFFHAFVRNSFIHLFAP